MNKIFGIISYVLIVIMITCSVGGYILVKNKRDKAIEEEQVKEEVDVEEEENSAGKLVGILTGDDSSEETEEEETETAQTETYEAFCMVDNVPVYSFNGDVYEKTEETIKYGDAYIIEDNPNNQFCRIKKLEAAEEETEEEVDDEEQTDLGIDEIDMVEPEEEVEEPKEEYLGYVWKQVFIKKGVDEVLDSRYENRKDNIIVIDAQYDSEENADEVEALLKNVIYDNLEEKLSDFGIIPLVNVNVKGKDNGINSDYIVEMTNIINPKLYVRFGVETADESGYYTVSVSDNGEKYAKIFADKYAEGTKLSAREGAEETDFYTALKEELGKIEKPVAIAVVLGSYNADKDVFEDQNYINYIGNAFDGLK